MDVNRIDKRIKHLIRIKELAPEEIDDSLLVDLSSNKVADVDISSINQELQTVNPSLTKPVRKKIAIQQENRGRNIFPQAKSDSLIEGIRKDWFVHPSEESHSWYTNSTMQRKPSRKPD